MNKIAQGLVPFKNCMLLNLWAFRPNISTNVLKFWAFVYSKWLDVWAFRPNVWTNMLKFWAFSSNLFYCFELAVMDWNSFSVLLYFLNRKNSSSNRKSTFSCADLPGSGQNVFFKYYWLDWLSPLGIDFLRQNKGHADFIVNVHISFWISTALDG